MLSCAACHAAVTIHSLAMSSAHLNMATYSGTLIVDHQRPQYFEILLEKFASASATGLSLPTRRTFSVPWVSRRDPKMAGKKRITSVKKSFAISFNEQVIAHEPTFFWCGCKREPHGIIVPNRIITWALIFDQAMQ